MKKDILIGKSLGEIEDIIVELGEKKFRGKQVFQWLYKNIKDLDDMQNIPLKLREHLKDEFCMYNMTVEEHLKSKIDGTEKYLFKIEDGYYIESVLMSYKYGNTICISSQAGCRMGCSFCASTIDGLKRNLTYQEMIQQILLVALNSKKDINHIVVMGSGEPFDNYENIKQFLRFVNQKDTLNIGMRNITVSTCGIIPKILEFAKNFPQVNLAISLHEVDDTKRSDLMPVNKSYNVSSLIETCKKYTQITNRRITFEYALVQGKNDDEQTMIDLAKLLKGILCHVNLIPLNYVDDIGIKGSDRKLAVKLKEILESKGIPTTVRRQLGSDINGACGQLRLQKSKGNL